MILLIFLTTFSLFAQNTFEESIIRSVLNNFPLIEEAQLKYLSSEQEVISSEGAFDHKVGFKSRNRIEDKYANQYFESIIERQTKFKGINLMAGHRQGRGLFPFYDGKLETSGAGEIFAGITLPILRNFQTDEARTQLEISRFKQRLAKAERELKENIYIHKALSLYYKWIFYNQKIKIRNDILAIAIKRQEMLDKKFKAGDVEKLKIIDNLRSIDKRKDELTKSEVEWLNTKTQLELFFRDDSGSPIKLERETYPQDDIKDNKLVFTEFSSLPQIKIIDQEIQIFRQKKEFYRQSQLPGLNLELLGARELSGNRPYDQSSLQVGVKFDFPIENQKAQGSTLSNEYQMRALEKQKEYLLQSLRQQYNFSLDALKMSRDRWLITTDEFNRTQILSESEKKRWEQGDSDLYIVNLREHDAADASIKRWHVWYEYHQYLLDSLLFSGKIRKSI